MSPLKKVVDVYPFLEGATVVKSTTIPDRWWGDNITEVYRTGDGVYYRVNYNNGSAPFIEGQTIWIKEVKPKEIIIYE